MTRTTRFIALALALAICPMGGLAQTHAGLLEQGIFLEETVGDLDGAIRIYRQIVTTHAVPRDVEAQAETRLAESLARKGQAPPAASSQAQQQGPGCCGFFSGNYDLSRPVTVSGTVGAVLWVNPETIVVVDGSDGNKWGFTLAAPNAMIRAGLNRNMLKLGEQVIVSGYLAKGIGENCPTSLPNACSTLAPLVGPRDTVPSNGPGAQFDLALGGHTTELALSVGGALHASARSINAADGRNLFDRVAMERGVAAGQR